MKIYIKFISTIFLKSFLNIFLIMFSLVFVLNILKEIEFLNNTDVNLAYPIYLSLLNSPSIVFEMFPFIFLISTQFFFIKLLNNDEINIFKYSGLKNLQMLKILSVLSFLLGLIIVTIYYNFSSTLQNYYLQMKHQFTDDKLYLAVINKNGLWIKDVINNEINIINSSKIDSNFLTNTFISRFNKDFELIESIKSDKIDIKTKEWVIYGATIFKENTRKKTPVLKFKSNFDQIKIESLFSNLSSLSILKLIRLRTNYKSLNYSIVDVNMQLYKIATFPILLVLMTILSSIIMFNTKKLNSITLKIIIGLFFSVTIYYINNFFNVMGSTEKIPLSVAIWSPILMLILFNSTMSVRLNEK